MKRFCSILLALLIVCTLSAKRYTHSLGVSTGFSYGVSYKTMLNKHLTVLDDLAYGFLISTYSGSYFTNHANVAYQGDIRELRNLNFDWYAGGGASLGFLNNGREGKVGANIIGGIEMNIVSAPISITCDFRPGYGLGFGAKYTDVVFDEGSMSMVEVETTHLHHFFDWGIVFGIRYTL